MHCLSSLLVFYIVSNTQTEFVHYYQALLCGEKSPCKAAQEGQSILEAACDYGVPKTTLYDRVSCKEQHGSKPGPNLTGPKRGPSTRNTQLSELPQMKSASEQVDHSECCVCFVAYEEDQPGKDWVAC